MSQTTVTFVETKSEEQLGTLCQWVEHFYDQGKCVQIVASSSLTAQQVDHLLWTFAQASFIPHRIGLPEPKGAAIEPVIITTDETPVDGATVLVCEGAVRIELMQRFEQVVHFVLLDDAERLQESRSLWQTLREKGCRVNHVSYASKGKSAKP